jgi:hypothetical protein
MENWKDIPNYEGLYQINENGDVKSINYKNTNKEGILKPCINTSGYKMVVLMKNNKRKSYYIHKLVAITFLNHKPCGMKQVINHIDFNKLNNNLNNLEIITQVENVNKRRIKTSSNYEGVSFHKNSKKWISRITIENKSVYLGIFLTEKEAYDKYLQIKETLL